MLPSFREFVESSNLNESVPHKITGTRTYEIEQTLKDNGFELDGADLADLIDRPKQYNGDKITLYKANKKSHMLDMKNSYTSTFNYYSDGGWEFINIKKNR